jgi:phenylpyruvate tautomerase PptA (4-oxalocrotonate tautomerase family)
MPTYFVWAPAGLLTPHQKERIAQDVTRTHNQVTRAEAFFAQVIFQDIPRGNWFMGGASFDSNTIFLQGFVRSGRTSDMKHDLLVQLIEVVAAAASRPRSRVWGYLCEMAPGLMTEHGHFLPAPGAELAWLAMLPAADRALMGATSHFV